MLYGRMPAWATVAVTLGASLIAVLGTLLGGLVQERRADNRARQAARSDRIARGMDVLARIQILLSDADPDRLGINVNREEPFGTLTPLSNDWHKSYRPALATFALADDSSEVRELGERLGVAVTNSLVATGWFLRDLTHPTPGGGDTRVRAVEDHTQARELAKQLEREIRES